MLIGSTVMSNLIEVVDSKINQVRTTSLDISFNELLDMYQNDELIISPAYQRLFRWNNGKQSRFIETLILELPLPPIFVIEIEEGKYELIDGLQRISSYLHFRGALEGKGSLKLEDCDIIEELNGNNYNNFPTTLQIKLKRNFIRVEVLRKASDPTLRYHMFKRLNSGGEILSEQEIRNCTIRILNPEINDFIIQLSNDSNFLNTISKVPSEEIEKKKNEELILRFFTLKNNIEGYTRLTTLDDYLTHYMESVANNTIDFNYIEEAKIFANTFMILNKILGNNIFSTELGEDRFGQNFILYYYDGLILGIQKYIDKIILFDDYQKLQEVFTIIKKDEKFYNARTGNRSNIKTRISIVEEKLAELLD